MLILAASGPSGPIQAPTASFSQLAAFFFQMPTGDPPPPYNVTTLEFKLVNPEQTVDVARVNCITRIAANARGQAFCVYLADGHKITVARDKSGRAWLQVSQQAVIKPMRCGG